MTTTYDWLEERERAIRLFNGDTPGLELEATILTHFQNHPGRVHDTIEAIGRRVTTGNVRSGWAILRAELDTTPPNVQATDQRERTAAILIAEHWTRNAGGYIDRPSEYLDAVFGHHGPLHQWRKDPALVERFTALYHDQRPRFQAAELEAETRQATHRRIRKASRSTTPTTDPDEHAANIAAEVERAHLAYLNSIAPEIEETG